MITLFTKLFDNEENMDFKDYNYNCYISPATHA